MEFVKYLLDTHTLLWAVQEPRRISVAVKDIIADESKELFVSSVSAYEVMLKHRARKLTGFEYVAENYHEVLSTFGVKHLQITIDHAHKAGSLDWGHRDPFDRILAAQAVVDDLTLLTDDAAFDGLDWIKTLW